MPPSKAFSKAPKKSPQPRFHAKSPEARAALWSEFNEFMAEYGVAAKALLPGRLDAVSWLPEGSYLPPDATAYARGHEVGVGDLGVG